MSAFVSKLSVLYKRADAHMRAMFMLPEREPGDFPFVASDIAQLHRVCGDPAAAVIDNATWKDMLLEPYCAALSSAVSIFGQQILYRRLRTGLNGTSPKRIKELVSHPERLREMHRTCAPLRHAEKEIATLLYEDAMPPIPAWADLTWMLPIAMAASVAAALWWSHLAWLATFAICYFMMVKQMRYSDQAEEWQRSSDSLQMLLRVASLLGGEEAAAAGKINRRLSRSPMLDVTPGLRAYLDWFVLANVNHYFRTARLVHANLPLLRQCFHRIANLEADVALARHLLRTPGFCWASSSGNATITLEDTVHPLLPEAHPLTLALEGRGAFISGQNGIGKSTLLRTLGINLIAARAFGFCYAKSAVLPLTPVYSSMQSEDSLLGGESLYMAELRRAKELLATAEGQHPGIYIIDEIFRGTNHLESVSAAASVLDVLAAKGGLVVVSSHNLVLASLLGHRLDPLCVARDGDGVLTLSRGVLAHTNGIALLSEHGFGGDVEAKAGRVFDWLNAYLAEPADCSTVLG